MTDTNNTFATIDGALPSGDTDLRMMYGENALFSQVGAFTLVHLDAPTPEILERRVQNFDPAEYFFDDCPLCQISKRDGGHIVFDGSGDDND